MKILESVYFKNIIQKDHWNHLLFFLCTLIFPVLTKLDASNASPLVIVAEKAGERASLKLNASRADCSEFESINLTVKNLSKNKLTVWGEVGNQGSRGAQDRCAGIVRLEPDEEKVLKVRLMWRPVAPSYKRDFEKFFMFFKNLNVRDNTIDPERVAWLKVWFTSKEAGDKVQVLKISTAGKRIGGQPEFYPFVDKYGQYKHVDWPGKVYNDEDLQANTQQKAGAKLFTDQPVQWNEYGGWISGPKLKATGFFYTAQYEGKWWLVDPKGNLFWSNGPTGVAFGGASPITDREHWFEELPKREGELGEFFGKASKARFKYYQHRNEYETFSYAHANLKRKYGEDWKNKAAAGVHEELRAWGINTCGGWSIPEIYEQRKTPYISVVHFGGPWITWEHSYRMPDPFNEEFRLAVREGLEAQKGTNNDPWNIGYCVNNELGWGAGKNGNKSAIATLALAWGGRKQAAKVEFVNDLKKKYQTISALNQKWRANYKSWDDMLDVRRRPNENHARTDLDEFSAKLAHQYFRVVREEVKRFAPNNLYLGCRFHGHIDNSLMAIAMEYVDVVSYNIYQNPPNRSFQYKELKNKKPLMVTEYGVETNPEQSPWRQDNLSPAPDQREKELKGYLDVLLRNPQFVGAHFFQHHDQALTGRNDGEALLRGFVDAVGSPNFRLIEVNRNFAFNMYEDRFNHVVKRTGEEGSYDLKANSNLDEGSEAIGIHHYSELGKYINKLGGGGDTEEYSWDNSARIRYDGDHKVEGNGSYRFNLQKGWSRWVLTMKNNQGIDISGYKQIKFAVSSLSAAKWDDFKVIIQDRDDNYMVAKLADLGFKPDGKFHWLILEIEGIKQAGVDVSNLGKIIQIAWGGGVEANHSFHLDGLQLLK